KQVSIHAPARGATVEISADIVMQMFQSTPLREGRHELHRQPDRRLWFQSTPLRAGRLPVALRGRVERDVSIHAPARGATPAFSATSPRRARFNPRPCARGDAGRLTSPCPPSRFQSTPLREGRPLSAYAASLHYEFQSTPLREGRHPDGAS